MPSAPVGCSTTEAEGAAEAATLSPGAAGSGWGGLLIGMSLGGVTPGGPMTHFPVIASLYKMGVGVGPMVAYLSAWSLFGLQRVIMWEIPFLGPQIVAIRVAVSFFFPLLAGWLCEMIWRKLNV